jgi:NADPH-dependent 2,4-dienoyl-CoA reductase/sulfur reductase-like enzyme/rhodanese-related sulfurtransferase
VPTQKLVIVGGVAGGATAAARARRLSETAEIIMFERDEYVSFANCGLPYHIGGEIAERDALLVQTVEGLTKRFNLDIRTRQEVIVVNPGEKTVTVRKSDGSEYTESYDSLLLAPGAAPLVPPIPGVDDDRVFTLRNMGDMDRIKTAVDRGVRSAVVVGGGFIGIEVAENLRHRDIEVTLVELQPQVMPPLDPEIAGPLHEQLTAHGVRLLLNSGVTEISGAESGLSVHLRDGSAIETEMVLLAVGVRPDSGLARDAGLDLNQRGAIVVDEHMRTSDPNIYAVGDAVQVRDALTGEPTLLPLAGPANRQARIAADNIFGIESTYCGVLGTSVVRVFDAVAASTGASEKSLKARGASYEKVYIHRGQHVGYFPGSQMMMIKLLFEPQGGKLLGAQIVGGDGVDKRIDVLATALKAGMTVFDLEELELAYAPQFGAAKDPVNIAGYAAANVIRKHEAVLGPEAITAEDANDWTLVDVREPDEFEAGHIPGALLLPLGQMRERWEEIPTDKPLAVYCAIGQRAYYATRILRANGLEPKNLTGGFKTWATYHALNG